MGAMMVMETDHETASYARDYRWCRVIDCGAVLASMADKECAALAWSRRGPHTAPAHRDEICRRQPKGSPKGISLRSSRNDGVLRRSAQSLQRWRGSIPPPVYLSPCR